jgi:hypothetical protein
MVVPKNRNTDSLPLRPKSSMDSNGFKSYGNRAFLLPLLSYCLVLHLSPHPRRSALSIGASVMEDEVVPCLNQRITIGNSALVGIRSFLQRIGSRPNIPIGIDELQRDRDPIHRAETFGFFQLSNQNGHDQWELTPGPSRGRIWTQISELPPTVRLLKIPAQSASQRVKPLYNLTTLRRDDFLTL